MKKRINSSEIRFPILEFYCNYIESEFDLSLEDVAAKPYVLYRRLLKNRKWFRIFGRLIDTQYPKTHEALQLLPKTPYKYYLWTERNGNTCPDNLVYGGNYSFLDNLFYYPQIAFTDSYATMIRGFYWQGSNGTRYDGTPDIFFCRLHVRFLEMLGLLAPLIRNGSVTIVRHWTSSKFRKIGLKPVGEPPPTYGEDDSGIPFGPPKGPVEFAREYIGRIDPYITDYGLSLSIPDQTIRVGLLSWLPYLTNQPLHAVTKPLVELNNVPSLIPSNKNRLQSTISDLVKVRTNEEVFIKWLSSMEVVRDSILRGTESGNWSIIDDCINELDDVQVKLNEYIKTSSFLKSYFGHPIKIMFNTIASLATGSFGITGLATGAVTDMLWAETSRSRSPIVRKTAAESANRLIDSLRILVTTARK